MFWKKLHEFRPLHAIYSTPPKGRVQNTHDDKLCKMRRYSAVHIHEKRPTYPESSSHNLSNFVSSDAINRFGAINRIDLQPVQWLVQRSGYGSHRVILNMTSHRMHPLDIYSTSEYPACLWYFFFLAYDRPRQIQKSKSCGLYKGSTKIVTGSY